METAFLAKITRIDTMRPSVSPSFNVEWSGEKENPLNASGTVVDTALRSWANSLNLKNATFCVKDGEKNKIVNIEAS